MSLARVDAEHPHLMATVELLSWSGDVRAEGRAKAAFVGSVQGALNAPPGDLLHSADRGVVARFLERELGASPPPFLAKE